MAMRSSSDGYADVVMGLQHGDEGKGRFIDDLAVNYDWIARYNGGPNAGHTVEANGHKLALHQIPSGVNHPDKQLYIGSNCVVNLVKLCAEIDEVERAGLSVKDRLHISPKASLIQPSHIIEDMATMKDVGTTGNGIGVTYAHRSLRVEGNRQLDVQLSTLATDTEYAFGVIRRNLEIAKEKYDVSIDVEAMLNQLRLAFDRVKDCIDRRPDLLRGEIRKGMRILLEGAQAFGLDQTYGITPDITSSNTGVAAAFQSTAIPVDYKRYAYGVAKMIPTRVGHGPFVTEFGGRRSEEYCMEEGGKKYNKEYEKKTYGHRLNELFLSDDPLEQGIAIRIDGDEYGASTGRPRRPGILDLQQLKYAIDVNGLDGIYFTKGDKKNVFSRMKGKAITIATGYALNGLPIDYVPADKNELSRVKPVITNYEAFSDDISHVRDSHHLPPQLLEVLRDTQDRIACRIIAVGVGPRREQVVQLNGTLD